MAFVTLYTVGMRRYFRLCACVIKSCRDMNENEMIARNIRKIRKGKIESQMDFAANCGLSVEEISLLEREKADPKLSTLQMIASYIGEPVAYLLTEKE